MAENQGVKERLLFYLQSKRISKSAFGTAIGASSSFVDAIRSSVSPERLERIMDEFPDLDIVWLLTGRGQMLTTAKDVAPAKNDVAPPIDVHHNGVVNINTLNEKLENIQRELADMKEERKQLLAIIEILSRQ